MCIKSRYLGSKNMNLVLTSMYLEQLCWLLNLSSTQTSLQDRPDATVHISDRNVLFSLLLWQLRMTWFGLPCYSLVPGSAFQGLCWPDSTRIANRKCLLFLGKLLWFWASKGQKAHCCQQGVVFSFSHWKYPWQVSLRSNPLLSILIPKPRFCLLVFCTGYFYCTGVMLHHDNEEWSANSQPYFETQDENFPYSVFMN